MLILLLLVKTECCFFLCGVVNVGCIGEILCCGVVSNVSTISSFTKCDGVWISCGVKIVALCY